MGATHLGLPASVRENPSPSARLVWLALREADEALSKDDLAAETGASTDQIRRVLADLENADLVESRGHPNDGRRTLWSAVDVDRGQGADKAGASTTHTSGKPAGDDRLPGAHRSDPRGGGP